MAFARDAGTAAYDDRRAAEYDEWYLGAGRYHARDRPGWAEDVDALVGTVGALPPARTLDVACGTAFLTRHLRGELVVGLDQSRSMVAIAQERLPRGLARRVAPELGGEVLLDAGWFVAVSARG